MTSCDTGKRSVRQKSRKLKQTTEKVSVFCFPYHFRAYLSDATRDSQRRL